MPRILKEGFPHRLGNHPANRSLFAELNFALGRVDVDVDGRRIDFEEQAANGVAPLHEGGMVAFEEGVVETSVVDGSPIDEKVLLVAG